MSVGWNVNSFTHLGKLQYEIPIFRGNIEELSPKEVFNLLPYSLFVLDERTRKRYMTDSDLYWDYKEGSFIDGIVILDVPEMTKYFDDKVMEKENQTDIEKESQTFTEKENQNITGIVIFTDGYAKFPEEEMAMNIPVLWLISNEHVTPPWGKVGRVVG